jgi:hypothetical protein
MEAQNERGDDSQMTETDAHQATVEAPPAIPNDALDAMANHAWETVGTHGMEEIRTMLEGALAAAWYEGYSLEYMPKRNRLREAYHVMSSAIGMAKMRIDRSDVAGARRSLDQASEAVYALDVHSIAREALGAKQP